MLVSVRISSVSTPAEIFVGLSTTMKYSVAREIGAGSLNKTKDRLKATDWKNNTFAIETADISNQRPNEVSL